MIFDLISSALGFVIPPAFDFIKKKFLKPNSDTPEATLSALATTKPDVMPSFIDAYARFKESETKYFNRDVIGQPSFWVVDLRAAIRPVFTVISLTLMFSATAFHWQIDQSIQCLMEITISSWFGSRLIN